MALRQTGIQLLVDCFLLCWKRQITGPTSSQLMIFDQSGPKVNAQVLLQRPQLHQCLDNFHPNVSSICILVVCNLRRWKGAQLQSYTCAGCIFPSSQTHGLFLRRCGGRSNSSCFSILLHTQLLCAFLGRGISSNSRPTLDHFDSCITTSWPNAHHSK